MNPKTSRISAVVLVSVSISAAGAGLYYYTYSDRAVKQAAAQANAANATNLTPKLSLLASDIATLAQVSLGQSVQASGSIRALQQAQIKSQVSSVVLNVAVQEGQTVQAGQVLATTDAQDYQSRRLGAQAVLAQATAQTSIAQRTVDNNAKLVVQGFISPTAAELGMQQLNASKAAETSAQASLALANKAAKDTAIVSPISGVITEKLIASGEKVSPDMRVFTVMKAGAIEFEGSLPTAEAAQLRVGQAISIEAEGMPAMAASISRINASVNPNTRSVSFFAALNANNAVRAGSYATGKITLQSSDTLAVPAAALREDAGRTVLYTLAIDGKTGVKTLAATPVTAGVRGEDSAGNAMVAVAGVPAGTVYIARNLGALRLGSVVTVTP
jgi:RND family efflux transporter MFP subunit